MTPREIRTRRTHWHALALYSVCCAAACACSENDGAPASDASPAGVSNGGGGSPAVALPGDVATPVPGAAGAPLGGGATNTGLDNEGPPDVTRELLPDMPSASEADAGIPVGAPEPACEPGVTEANKAVVSAAIDELFVQGDITAVDRYWGEPYLQHNPIAASGVDAFRMLFSGLISPGNSIYALSRLIGECGLVLIHGNYTSFGGPTFDLFRVEAGRIVEHWDAAATGAGPNASGHTALDGDTTVTDVPLGAQNENLVVSFVEDVLIGGDLAAIGDYMSPSLIEHDPASTDGSDAFVGHLQSGAITYSQIHHQIADGNFVFVLSEGAAAGAAAAHYDLFRVENARIVEHWNGRRDVPATTQSGLGIF